LAASFALFALGGAMGFLIDGSDTRTPAHYHAVITAVSVSSAGMLLTFGLKELGKPEAPPRPTRLLLGLYGGGQFVASIAMFIAGGYGALRKLPAGAESLDTVAAPAWRRTGSPRSSPSSAARFSSSSPSGRWRGGMASAPRLEVRS